MNSLIRLLLLAIGLCCMDIGSAHPTLDKNNVTVAEEPTEGLCRPTVVYISWTKIRHYLNSFLGHSIAADIKGPPLPVMRCRNFLTPCPASHSYCGVSSENYVWEALPLKERGVETGEALYLEFKEDNACMCVAKKIYKHRSAESIESPPYILAGKIEKLPEGKKAKKLTSREESREDNKVTSVTKDGEANEVTQLEK